jgi:hypothetical protein
MRLENFRHYPSLIAKIPQNKFYESRQLAQFKREGQPYMAVGEFVSDERLESIKKTNLRVNDEQWLDFLVGAAIHAGLEGDINFVGGFPRETLEENNNLLKTLVGHEIRFCTPVRVGGKNVIQDKSITIKSFWAVYEAFAQAIGVMDALDWTGGELLVMSLGFGTVEAALVTKEGVPARHTVFGERIGIKRAVEIFFNSLNESGLNETSISGKGLEWKDMILRSAYDENEALNIKLGGKIADVKRLKVMADAALTEYTQDVLINNIRESIEKNAANTKMKVCVTGGGALYYPVISNLDVMLRKDGHSLITLDGQMPLFTAARGYHILASSKSAFEKNTLIVDNGNCNTVVYVEEGKQ